MSQVCGWSLREGKEGMTSRRERQKEPAGMEGLVLDKCMAAVPRLRAARRGDSWACGITRTRSAVQFEVEGVRSVCL